MISTNSNCNDKKRGCITTSSECVIWQGPNIECIDLCTGDSISTVVATLANELCALLNQFDVNANIDCISDFIDESDNATWSTLNQEALEHIKSGDATLSEHIEFIYKVLCLALDCCEDKPDIIDTHGGTVSPVSADMPSGARPDGVAELTDKEYEDLIAQGAEIEILTGGGN